MTLGFPRRGRQVSLDEPMLRAGARGGMSRNRIKDRAPPKVPGAHVSEVALPAAFKSSPSPLWDADRARRSIGNEESKRARQEFAMRLHGVADLRTQEARRAV